MAALPVPLVAAGGPDAAVRATIDAAAAAAVTAQRQRCAGRPCGVVPSGRRREIQLMCIAISFR
jgi:hypothetical protein